MRKSVQPSDDIKFIIRNDTDFDVQMFVVYGPPSILGTVGDAEQGGWTIPAGSGPSYNTGFRGTPLAFRRKDNGREVACVCFTGSEECQLLSAAIAMCEASPKPWHGDLLGNAANHPELKDDGKWRAFVKAVGPLVQLRRPHRRVTVKSTLTPLKYDGSYEWRGDEKLFYYGRALPGFLESDGIQTVCGDVRLERENGEPVKDTFPGLQTLVGTTINASEMGKMRIVHEFMQYDTVLASARAVRDGSAPELARGYVRCTPRKLTKEERAAYLEPTDDDGPTMLKALESVGLQRTKDCCTGRYDMPDWMFVQRLAFKIFDHVKYDAGKSVALNSGKPPSNIFISGYAECGKFTAATVNACRVSGIPARGLLNNPHCYDDPFFFGTHGGVAVYLEHAGWVHYEPQNRVLGDYTWGLDCDTQYHTSTGLHPKRADDYKTLNCGTIGLQHAMGGCLLLDQPDRGDGVTSVPLGHMEDVQKKYEIGKLCGLSDEQNYCHPTNLTKWQGSNPKVEGKYESVVITPVDPMEKVTDPRFTHAQAGGCGPCCVVM